MKVSGPELMQMLSLLGGYPAPGSPQGAGPLLSLLGPLAGQGGASLTQLLPLLQTLTGQTQANRAQAPSQPQPNQAQAPSQPQPNQAQTQAPPPPPSDQTRTQAPSIRAHIPSGTLRGMFS